jgi:hypothetical protein
MGFGRSATLGISKNNAAMLPFVLMRPSPRRTRREATVRAGPFDRGRTTSAYDAVVPPGTMKIRQFIKLLVTDW